MRSQSPTAQGVCLWIIVCLTAAGDLPGTLPVIPRHGYAHGETVYVDEYDLASRPGVNLIDLDELPHEVRTVEREGGEVQYVGDDRGTVIEIPHGGTRVRVRDDVVAPRCVEGKFADGYQCSVLIDTGSQHPMFVTPPLVEESGLGFCPLEMARGMIGMVRVDELKIGTMCIRNSPCECKGSYYEKRESGEIAWKDNRLMLGLPVLRRFSHISIDNVSQEAGFFMTTFHATEDGAWRAVPFDIRIQETTGMERIYVDFLLGGQIVSTLLDTGYDGGLEVAQSTWERRVEPHVEVINTKQVSVLSWRGIRSVEAYLIRRLDVHSVALRNVVVMVEEDELLPEYSCLMGIGCFQKRQIVLDFERSTLWVKQAEERRSRSSSSNDPAGEAVNE